MTTAQIIQFLGVAVSFLVICHRLLESIRLWRGGSPELRIVREQIVDHNKRVTELLDRIIDRLERR